MKARYYQRKSFFLLLFPFIFSTISSDIPLFVDIELASPVAGSSGSTSAGLKTQPDVKKKRVNSVYFHSVSYKKPRNLKVDVRVVDLSAGLLSLADIGNTNSKFSRSWDSKMESEVSSMSGLSDLENLKNTIIEGTSYADSDVFVVDNMKDDTTPKKTCTYTYVLGKPLKTPSFDVLSDNDDIMAFPSSKFAGSKKLQSIGSYASEKCIFNPVKSFALDIGISVLPGKTIGNKLIAMKKIFYQVDGFGDVSALSKFLDIIRSFFTSELSLIKAKELAVSEKILVNIDVRKPNIHSDWKLIVKKILVDLSRLVIESVFSKFGHVISIRIQLIRLWQKALVEFESSDVVNLVVSKWSVFVNKDSVHALLYTLSISIIVHDLSNLVNSYDRKTCFIGCNLSSYMRNRCVIVCFADETFKLAAIGSVSVYKGVNLHWANLSLAYCAKCKCFGHIFNMCLVDQICLANIYKKKQAPVAYPVSFVASGLSSHVFSSVPSGAGSTLSAKPLVVASDSLNNTGLTDCMVL
ncbi:hypothetical protein G9A89_022066 [Geosiphon pyriformis]|nr:hypothetical protein G9A89_022066 [Geosiphon pyriformis]